MAQNDAPYIPGTIYHMIFIYGTHVSGPLLESKVMCEIFQKKGKVREKMLKKGKIFENLCKMFKIWDYFEKGQVIVCDYCMQ